MTDLRHVVAFSGGKDSSALAIYLHDPERWRLALGKDTSNPRPPIENPEYVFCDTGNELEETYEYLERLEAYLGKPITRLHPDSPPGQTPFDHYLKLYGGFLPSPSMRWCTRVLKIKPYERYVGEDKIISYVGIRADEGSRVGYISTKDNITTVFPFKEDGIDKADVYRILDESGVGRPEYYEWRSRSGCYFCFYQRKSEWVGLLEKHPDLYKRARAYEKEGFSWSQDETLDDLRKEERVNQIKSRLASAKEKQKQSKFLIGRNELFDSDADSMLLDELRDQEDGNTGCFVCHI